MNILYSPSDLLAMMTSLEIANLTGKQHLHVMRDIRAMIASLQQNPSLDSAYRSSTYTSETGQKYRQYELDKDLTLTLLTGYDANARYKVVKRWQELEGNSKPKSRLELAKEQVRLIEALERKEREVETLKITLDESKQWASVKRMEMKHVCRFDWRPLKEYSLVNDIEIQEVFDANYGKVNSYRADVWSAVYNVKV